MLKKLPKGLYTLTNHQMTFPCIGIFPIIIEFVTHRLQEKEYESKLKPLIFNV